jgi:hypothetical protein
MSGGRGCIYIWAQEELGPISTLDTVAENDDEDLSEKVTQFIRNIIWDYSSIRRMVVCS